MWVFGCSIEGRARGRTTTLDFVFGCYIFTLMERGFRCAFVESRVLHIPVFFKKVCVVDDPTRSNQPAALEVRELIDLSERPGLHTLQRDLRLPS